MPMLGGVYIDTVYSDEVDGSVNVSKHAVELGVDIADHVKAEADTFSISGVIVGENASGRRNQIISMMKSGRVVEYVNRLALSDVIITSFRTTHDVKVKGGMEFRATLEHIRIAKPVTVKANHTLTGTVSNLGLQQPIGTTPNKVVTVTATNNTVKKVAAKAKVTPQKLYDQNRHILSASISSKMYPGSKLVVPLM